MSTFGPGFANLLNDSVPDDAGMGLLDDDGYRKLRKADDECCCGGFYEATACAVCVDLNLQPPDISEDGTCDDALGCVDFRYFVAKELVDNHPLGAVLTWRSPYQTGLPVWGFQCLSWTVSTMALQYSEADLQAIEDSGTNVQRIERPVGAAFFDNPVECLCTLFSVSPPDNFFQPDDTCPCAGPGATEWNFCEDCPSTCTTDKCCTMAGQFGSPVAGPECCCFEVGQLMHYTQTIPAFTDRFFCNCGPGTPQTNCPGCDPGGGGQGLCTVSKTEGGSSGTYRCGSCSVCAAQFDPIGNTNPMGSNGNTCHPWNFICYGMDTVGGCACEVAQGVPTWGYDPCSQQHTADPEPSGFCIPASSPPHPGGNNPCSSTLIETDEFCNTPVQLTCQFCTPRPPQGAGGCYLASLCCYATYTLSGLLEDCTDALGIITQITVEPFGPSECVLCKENLAGDPTYYKCIPNALFDDICALAGAAPITPLVPGCPPAGAVGCEDLSGTGDDGDPPGTG